LSVMVATSPLSSSRTPPRSSTSGSTWVVVMAQQ
jgi:hypothetical protein